MPLEPGVRRIHRHREPVDRGPLDIEVRLADILDAHIGIAFPTWLVIGPQVRMAHGPLVDLLAIDRYAKLGILELKRNKTCRDIVARLLDYGSWVRDLGGDAIAQIVDDHPEALPAPSRADID